MFGGMTDLAWASAGMLHMTTTFSLILRCPMVLLLAIVHMPLVDNAIGGVAGASGSHSFLFTFRNGSSLK